MQAISSRSIPCHPSGALVLAGLFVVVGLAIPGIHANRHIKEKLYRKKRRPPGRNSRLRKLTATRTTQQWRSEPFTSTFQKTNSLNSVGA